jgi:hypothetical protein
MTSIFNWFPDRTQVDFAPGWLYSSAGSFEQES